MLVPSASLPLIAFNGGHDAVALLCLRRALQLYSTESCGYLFHAERSNGSRRVLWSAAILTIPIQQSRADRTKSYQEVGGIEPPGSTTPLQLHLHGCAN